MIRITCKKENFRRAGMSHPKGPAEYPDDRFTAEQLAALTADPMFTVEVLPDAPAKSTEEGVTDESAPKTGPAEAQQLEPQQMSKSRKKR